MKQYLPSETTDRPLIQYKLEKMEKLEQYALTEEA